MLSRIAKATNLVKQPSILFRCVATSSNNANAAQATPSDVRRYPHDAPERDFVNFPPLRVPEQPGKIRIGLVPDEWFKAMYDKTGVTGPYILFWGAVTTMLSKEIFVYWADTAEQLVFLTTVIAISKLYGKQIGEYLDREADKGNKAIVADLENQTKEIDVKIQSNQALETLPEANQIIHAAKREAVDLQLEASFRHRLAQVHQEVTRRLDYQVSVQSVYKRLEREQAINYILGEVNKSIGPAQEKESFQSGLNALKALSKKYANTI